MARIQAGTDAAAAFDAIVGSLERLGNQEDALWLRLGVTGCLG